MNPLLSTAAAVPSPPARDNLLPPSAVQLYHESTTTYTRSTTLTVGEMNCVGTESRTVRGAAVRRASSSNNTQTGSRLSRSLPSHAGERGTGCQRQKTTAATHVAAAERAGQPGANASSSRARSRDKIRHRSAPRTHSLTLCRRTLLTHLHIAAAPITAPATDHHLHRSIVPQTLKQAHCTDRATSGDRSLGRYVGR